MVPILFIYIYLCCIALCDSKLYYWLWCMHGIIWPICYRKTHLITSVIEISGTHSKEIIIFMTHRIPSKKSWVKWHQFLKHVQMSHHFRQVAIIMLHIARLFAVQMHTFLIKQVIELCLTCNQCKVSWIQKCLAIMFNCFARGRQDVVHSECLGVKIC